MTYDELHNFLIHTDKELEQAGLPSYTDVVAMVGVLRWYLEYSHVVSCDKGTIEQAKAMLAKFDVALGLEAE